MRTAKPNKAAHQGDLSDIKRGRNSLAKMFETADAIRRSNDKGLAPDRIARSTSYSVATVRRFLWISKHFGPDERKIVFSNSSSFSVGSIVHKYASQRRRFKDRATLREALFRDASLKRSEALRRETPSSQRDALLKDAIHRHSIELVVQRLRTQVKTRVTDPKKGWGEIVIAYFGEDDLERILSDLAEHN